MGHKNRLVIFGAYFALAAAAAYGTEKEPLPDYVGRFNKLDAKIRAINSDVSCTNYLTWVDEAVEAKRKLKLHDEIAPWLDELASTHSNNWRILHAVSCGSFSHRFVDEMDQAYRLAILESPPDKEMGQFCSDYIDLLLMGLGSEPYLLQAGPSYRKNQVYEESIQKMAATNLSSRLQFYALPDSYEQAANNGELIRWLIATKPEEDFTAELDRNHWDMQDFAVLLAGSHINLSDSVKYPLHKRAYVATDADCTILSGLKDNETVIWGDTPGDYLVVQLPDEYNYINAYEKRAAQGDRKAAETLGQIFINRCQLDRAAHYFEMAGEPDRVKSIQARQGAFLSHSPRPEGTPISIDYIFRNGSEAFFEISPLEAGTNLLARLINGQVHGTEIELLQGQPGPFQKTDAANESIHTGEKIAAWSVTLSPPPDYQDAIRTIDIPPLKAGNYLLRGTIRGGNTSETVLHIYDTLLYSAVYSREGYSDESRFYLLCDARTGKPLSGTDVHCFKLADGGSWSNYNRDVWNDAVYHVRDYHYESTDRNGLFTLNHDQYYYNTRLANLQHPFPFATIGTSATFDISKPDTYHHEDSQDEDSNWFMTTDRPLYRPGDTGHLKLWHPDGEYRDPPKLELSTQTNHRFPTALETSPDEEGEIYGDIFGGLDYSFTIPSNAPLGQYTVTGRYESFYQGDCHFRVEEYRTPEFDIAATLTDPQSIKIQADYTYGKPLPGGELKLHLYYTQSDHAQWFPNAPFDFLWGKGYWWNGSQFTPPLQKENADSLECSLHLSTNLNLTGQFTLDLSTVPNGLEASTTPGYFEIHANVTDTAHKQVSRWIPLPVNLKERSLCCWTDKAFYAPDQPIQCQVDFEHQTAPLHLEVSTLIGSNRVSRKIIPITGPDEIIELKPLPCGIHEAQLVSGNGNTSPPFQFAILGDELANPSKKEPLQLILEKGQYISGDTVNLLILTDQPGRYVYLFNRIDDSETLPKPQVIYMEKTSKVVPLTIENDKGLLQCAAMTLLDGKHHLVTRHIPIISADQEAGTLQLSPSKQTYNPGETVTLSIQSRNADEQGRPASVTVTVYNKSLDLLAGNVRSPNIFKTLFSSWVNTLHQTIALSDPHRTEITSIYPDWAMWVINPTGTTPLNNLRGMYESISIFGSALSIGVDEPLDTDSLDLSFKTPRIREDFRDLAYWNGTIETDSNGCAQVSFPMPDGLVEWKIQAWAVHTNYAASATTSIRCAKDFVVQLNTPRFMTEGDEVEISASLRNHTTNALEVIAACSESGSVIQVESPLEISIPDLAADQQTLLYWNTKAATPGTGHITVSARSPTCADGMKKPIPVLPHGMLKRGGHGGVLAGNNARQSFGIVLPKNVDPDSISLQLNSSTDMLDALIGALPFLAEYPYGCTEQTLNRFLPAVITLQTMDQLGLDTLTQTNAMPAERQALLNRIEIIKRTRAGVARLEETKQYRGWGWNMDDSSPVDPLTTAWVLRGLSIASKNVYVDQNTINDLIRDTLSQMDVHATSAVTKNKNILNNTDAMLALVVSETGTEGISRYNQKHHKRLTDEENQNSLLDYMDLLFEHADQLSLYGKVLLANAFDLQGDTVHRDELIRYIEQYLESDPMLGTYWLRTSSNDWWYWYNDHIETIAWYLKLLNRTEPHSDKTAGVVRYLMQNRIYGNHWKSTRDTAICVEALCEYSINNHKDAPEKGVTITLNGQPFNNPEEAQLVPGTNTLAIASENGTPVFFDATWHYYTREKPIASEQCDLVSITRSYSRIETASSDEATAPTSEGLTADEQLLFGIEDMNYRPLTNEKLTPLNAGDILQAGDRIVVKLEINASQPLEYLLAEDFKPAGFETIDTISGYADGAYRELHDERVSYYLRSIRKGTTTMSYRMRAEHAGTVSALPATVGLMYEPRQAANTEEREFIIER
ncbi:alpha-2-macroglobulin family protein [Pontiellaceae bacterium B1224]|nr:alpha-2-macroglobulin family protein [Pontiellaceae bacterium B1224]